jgi:hypothetical protein
VFGYIYGITTITANVANGAMAYHPDNDATTAAFPTAGTATLHGADANIAAATTQAFWTTDTYGTTNFTLNWNFTAGTGIWKMPSVVGYPVLAWQ